MLELVRNYHLPCIMRITLTMLNFKTGQVLTAGKGHGGGGNGGGGYGGGGY